MIRTIIDRVRTLIVGQNLIRVARLPLEDINQLLALAGDDYQPYRQAKAAGTQQAMGEDLGELQAEIQDLKQEICVLREKLAVFERGLANSSKLGQKQKHIEQAVSGEINHS